MGKELEKPKRPNETECRACGARVYEVDAAFGKSVVLDVEPMRVCSLVELFLGRPEPAKWTARQLTLGWNLQIALRARFRRALVQDIGGYRLTEPERFYGATAGSPCSWQWFAQPVDLHVARYDRQPLHAEHWTTCHAMTAIGLRAKLSNVALVGEGAGDPEMKSSRKRLRLNLQGERAPLAHARLLEQALAESPAQSPRPAGTAQEGLATDRHPSLL